MSHSRLKRNAAQPLLRQWSHLLFLPAYSLLRGALIPLPAESRSDSRCLRKKGEESPGSIGRSAR